jgi:chemotaxis protein methyltransferase CheR
MSEVRFGSAVADPLGPADISDMVFGRFRDLIYREAGISLTDGKKTLLVGRLAGRLRELGVESFESYYELVADPTASDERARMLDRICTNETHFFRDPRQWEFLDQQFFPRLEERVAESGTRRIHAWSAACSTGEEPYSLAMTLLSRFPPATGWQVEILATDLSTKVLSQARAGLWSIDKAEDIPLSYRKEFMLRGTGGQSGKMKAGPELRSVIKFDRLNLNTAAYGVNGPFDLIFCRNVLIYFDLPSKSLVIDRLLHHLAPGGCLFMGYAETTTGISDGLTSVGPNVYGRADEDWGNRGPNAY